MPLEVLPGMWRAGWKSRSRDLVADESLSMNRKAFAVGMVYHQKIVAPTRRVDRIPHKRM
jgi:hypothetical protein